MEGEVAEASPRVEAAPGLREPEAGSSEKRRRREEPAPEESAAQQRQPPPSREPPPEFPPSSPPPAQPQRCPAEPRHLDAASPTHRRCRPLSAATAPAGGLRLLRGAMGGGDRRAGRWTEPTRFPAAVVAARSLLRQILGSPDPEEAPNAGCPGAGDGSDRGGAACADASAALDGSGDQGGRQGVAPPPASPDDDSDLPTPRCLDEAFAEAVDASMCSELVENAYPSAAADGRAADSGGDSPAGPCAVEHPRPASGTPVQASCLQPGSPMERMPWMTPEQARRQWDEEAGAVIEAAPAGARGGGAPEGPADGASGAPASAGGEAPVAEVACQAEGSGAAGHAAAESRIPSLDPAPQQAAAPPDGPPPELGPSTSAVAAPPADPGDVAGGPPPPAREGSPPPPQEEAAARPDAEPSKPSARASAEPPPEAALAVAADGAEDGPDAAPRAADGAAEAESGPRARTRSPPRRRPGGAASGEGAEEAAQRAAAEPRAEAEPQAEAAPTTPKVESDPPPPPLNPSLAIRRTLWRSQIPFLYRFMAIHRRTPPATSLAWVPGVGGSHAGDGVLLQRMIVGTRESIQLVVVQFARDAVDEDLSREDASGCRGAGSPQPRLGQTPSAAVGARAVAGGAGGKSLAGAAARLHAQLGSARARTSHLMPHDGPVRSLARSPHRDLLLATQGGGDGGVLLFDASRWPAEAPACWPDVRLAVPGGAPGGEGSGRGLAWNLEVASRLIAAEGGGVVRLWDAEAESSVAEFSRRRGGSAAPVAAVAFSSAQCSVFAACDAAGCIGVWDVRARGDRPSAELRRSSGAAPAHGGGASSLAFGCGAGARLLATGGGDGAARLWDLRTAREVHELRWDCGKKDAAAGAVQQVEWSPFDEGVLATSAGSGHVLLWDIGLIGAPQTPQAASEGPPEMFFVHGGHFGEASITAAWNPTTPWLLASCGDGHVPGAKGESAARSGELHVWQPAGALLPLVR